MSLAKCPVCKAPAHFQSVIETFGLNIVCYRCGAFRMDQSAKVALERVKWSELQIATASGYIRRNQGMMLAEKEVERLDVLRAPSAAEKAARLLVHLGQEHSQPGLNVLAPVWDIEQERKTAIVLHTFNETSAKTSEETERTQLEWLGVASASNRAELRWLIYDYLFAQVWLGQGCR